MEVRLKKIMINFSNVFMYYLFSNFRLYDTYGFPVDLTQLMAEERGMSVDEEGYKNAEKEAKETSKGKTTGVEDTLSLDVHAINELKEKGFNPTDDSIKYNYKALTEDKNAEYNFDSCTRQIYLVSIYVKNRNLEIFNLFSSTIVAIRYNKQFVNEVSSGQNCGILLDQTCFYAEQGGQIYDEGFLVKVDDDSVEVKVSDVQVRGGFILHLGRVEGIEILFYFEYYKNNT